MRKFVLYHILLLVLGFYILSNYSARCQSLPQGFFSYEMINGLSAPTSITFLDKNHILVSEKSGSIKLVKSDGNTIENYFSVNSEATGERGLQDILVHPNFDSFPYLYLYYTRADGAKNRLSRIKISDNFEPLAEEVLAEFDSLKDAIYHNGGGMAIYGDKIYLGIGDQYTFNSDNLDSYSGKVLRLNLDGSLPDDNPFNGNEVRRSIWGYGLRNPFKMDIDATNGRILVNDVGYAYWEEVNDATSAKAFFGWPYGEGDIAHINPATPFVDPIFKYANNFSDKTSPAENRGCAISSASFYRPKESSFPNNYDGKFFFSDLCNDWIRILDPTTLTSEIFAKDIGSTILGLETHPEGSLVYLDINSGTVTKIIYDPSPTPKFLREIDDVFSSIGDTVSIRTFFSGSPDLKVRWLKDNNPLQDDDSPILSLKDLKESDAGYYRAIVYNTYGVDSSNVFKVIINDFNTKPVPKLAFTEPGDLYICGDTIYFKANATDLEDGTLDASKLQLTLNFHHETHFHPGPKIFQDQKGYYFVVPRFGEISTHVWYRINLTVTDSQGTSSTIYIEVFPKIIKITIVSDPNEVSLLLESKPIQTPYEFESVAGGIRTIDLNKAFDVAHLQYFLVSHDETALTVHPESDSTIQIVYKTNEEFVRVFPNPASSNLNLSFISPSAMDCNLEIFSTSGALTIEKRIQVVEGANTLQVDCGTLSNGIYHVLLTGAGFIKQFKVAIE